MKPMHLLLFVLFCFNARGAAAVPGKVEPELAPNAELLAKIAALPDNTWMKLPPVKTTGDMGVLNKDPDYKFYGPMVRDFCNKMVWAPDRKRAMYCGGGHNVNPYNDVWEYDLASNTWACLYGADPVPSNFAGPEKEAEGLAWFKEHAVIKDGVVRTPRGGPLRALHTWWSLCYDSDQKRMLFLESHKGLGFVNTALLAKAYNLDPKDPILRVYGSVAGEASLFSFDPQSREWKDVLTKIPKAYESSCMEYLSQSKGIWWYSANTYTCDASNKEWKTMSSKDGPGAGAETAYDPESKKVVAINGAKTWVYSCDTGRWTLAQENAPDDGNCPYSTFCYDSIAKKFVLYTYAGTKDKPFPDAGARLWLYDVKENKWTDPAPPGERSKAQIVAGYFDPERNVTVIYNTRETWVYRCKRAGK